MSDEPKTDPELDADSEAAETTDQEAPAANTGETTAEAAIADLKDKLLRAMADAENTRRRADKDKQEAAKFGFAKFARDLLSVADNMGRAIATVPDDQRDGIPEVARNLILGVEMIEKEMLATFEKHGIHKVEPYGEKFDPNRHQAVAEVPGSGQPDGTVVEVFQVGYAFEDRLLRPAMVTVAKGEAKTEPSDPGASVDTTA